MKLPNLGWVGASLALCAAVGGFAAGCSSSEPGDGDTTGTTATTETTASTTATTATTETTAATTETTTGDEEYRYPFCAPAATCPPDVSAVDLTTPVSFSTQVYPILFEKCSGNGSCHHQGSGGTNAPTSLSFAHAPAAAGESKTMFTATELQTQVAAWIADAPRFAPTAKLVVPSDWQNSFLMMKIDGCQNEMGLSCTVPQEYIDSLLMVCYDTFGGDEVDPTSCGGGMPLANMPSSTSPKEYPLDDADKATIRAWIAQGAQVN